MLCGCLCLGPYFVLDLVHERSLDIVLDMLVPILVGAAKLAGGPIPKQVHPIDSLLQVSRLGPVVERKIGLHIRGELVALVDEVAIAAQPQGAVAGASREVWWAIRIGPAPRLELVPDKEL